MRSPASFVAAVLLQLAMFVGRSSGISGKHVRADGNWEWAVTDSGVSPPLSIMGSDCLSSCALVEDMERGAREVATGLPDGARTAMLAAANQLSPCVSSSGSVAPRIKRWGSSPRRIRRREGWAGRTLRAGSCNRPGKKATNSLPA
jgi:hypothetical protein